MNENDRIPVEELNEHPFIVQEYLDTPLSDLDINSFTIEMERTKRRYSSYSNAP